jgi:hypothetical protein
MSLTYSLLEITVPFTMWLQNISARLSPAVWLLVCRFENSFPANLFYIGFTVVMHLGFGCFPVSLDNTNIILHGYVVTFTCKLFYCHQNIICLDLKDNCSDFFVSPFLFYFKPSVLLVYTTFYCLLSFPWIEKHKQNRN